MGNGIFDFSQAIASHAGEPQAFYKFQKDRREILETSVKASPEYKAQQEFKRQKARLTQEYNMPEGPCKMKRADLKKMKKWKLITGDDYNKALNRRAKYQIRFNDLDSINSETSNLADYDIFQ